MYTKFCLTASWGWGEDEGVGGGGGGGGEDQGDEDNWPCLISPGGS